MRVPTGDWDGAQPRTHVFGVLRQHGVKITETKDHNWFELEDFDGDTVVLYLPNPIIRAQTVYLYRRFGDLHGFELETLVPPRRRS
ncbi:MAG: hypothetical protein ACREO3_05425 [Arenimonas sp.]